MIRNAFRAFPIVAAGLLGLAGTLVAQAPEPDVLMPVRSRYLDELRLRPGADLSAYRRVLIDPSQISMHEGWLRDMNTRKAAARRVSEEEAKRIGDDAAASLRTAVAGAFRASGYEITAEPGPGVLRLSPRITGLYVNAPEALATGMTKLYTREAGKATLILEARDSDSGRLLARVVHHDEAGAMRGFSRASDVANRFWFDALYNRWAANCAREFAAARPAGTPSMPR